MPIVSTFPDLEAVVRKALAAANIAQVGPRWYSSVPSEPDYPLGTVQRIGGLPAVRLYLDAASIQVDVWGESKSQARDIAASARTAIFALEGLSVTDPVTAFISGVEDSLGLTWLPDPLTAKDRYLFGVTVYGRDLAMAENTDLGLGFGGDGYGE